MDIFSRLQINGFSAGFTIGCLVAALVLTDRATLLAYAAAFLATAAWVSKISTL